MSKELCPSELFIVLSNFCNFKCAHCVTSSGPKETEKFQISDDEINSIANWVKNNHNIKRIHFSGGEPSLFIDEIIKIQKLLPNLSYAMTSNGWFGKNAKKIFSKIKIDKLFISFDKFRLPFTGPSKISDAVDSCSNIGIDTYVKLTISSHEDLMLLAQIDSKNIKIVANTLVSSGRAREEQLNSKIPNDSKYWDNTCPSLLEERIDGLERIVYFPGRGLTPCCGPLSDSKTEKNSFVFSALNDNYFEENYLYASLKKGSFKEQNPIAFSLNSSQHNTSCSICEIIYGRLNSKEIPPIADLKREDAQTHYPLNSYFDSSDIIKLCSHFKSAYILEKMSLFENVTNIDQPFFAIEKINIANSTLAVDFFIKIFMNKFNSLSPYLNINEMKIKLKSFLESSDHSFLFYLNNKPVGIIGLYSNMWHPLLLKRVNHIGVLGYDQQSLTKKQIDTIKLKWINILKGVEPNSLSFTARVDLFNAASINLFSKMGFIPCYLELSKYESI